MHDTSCIFWFYYTLQLIWWLNVDYACWFTAMKWNLSWNVPCKDIVWSKLRYYRLVTWMPVASVWKFSIYGTRQYMHGGPGWRHGVSFYEAIIPLGFEGIIINKSIVLWEIDYPQLNSPGQLCVHYINICGPLEPVIVLSGKLLKRWNMLWISRRVVEYAV